MCESCFKSESQGEEETEAANMRSLRGTDGESQTEEELNRRWNKSWTRKQVLEEKE